MNARITSLTAALLLALPLAACGTDDEAVDTAAATAATDDSMADDSEMTPDMAAITFEDGWVKSADEGMTSAFGTLTNHTDKDIEIVSVEADFADMPQLHETVTDSSGASEMQQVSGFVVPAEGTYELAPGADHLMLMGLNEPVESGTSADVTLVSADGTEWVLALPVREFDGAEETYDEGQSEMDTDSEMDMGSDEETADQ
ncbi:copper chaperone PCu(A)C [Ornithinimicrobium sp. INDO-MA30-4]|uniref:copper chaperone PCu(A)C n=1 Tax=Ornithinimicrobium sp. INDO-MA30-4 TaxID=2908651 RepID=UPI001F45D62A|nr:copper chaperone PCu(A)C [Ornithinimicrobium sp. INDO-MA30-4]UJH71190.1 copper chaperone PCu(A)C [Ornithinimicrobium sp. INDO-MA30-4]